jgi:hypothetical protein
MTAPASPFSLPEKLPLELNRVREYWQSLKRGEASMPFWDDVKLSSLPDLSGRLMLVDVFENPQRFRLNSIGQDLGARYGANVTGKFVDEIEVRAPFEYLAAQSSATIEGRAATFYARDASKSAPLQQDGYARLLLPLWGNGRIEMVLGAVSLQESAYV